MAICFIEIMHQELNNSVTFVIIISTKFMILMNRLLPVFLFICSLWICSSCEELFPELPEETQYGAQTFGCLVNNELVFAREANGYNRVGRVNAVYYLDTERLEITATCQFNQKFIFYIDHPQERVESKLNQIRYFPPNSSDWIDVENTGKIYLTRFHSGDLRQAQEVISGTFSFELPETDGQSIKVTKGRFDLDLSIIRYQY